MEDTLVGFEVAKLAKEKGFNWKVRYSFGHEINPHIAYPNEDYSIPSDFNSPNMGRNWKNLYSAPTQSLLQRWLREKHGLIISIEPTFTYALTTNVGYYAYVKKVNKEINTLEYLYLDIYFSATYEESLESGLLEALKLI